MGVDDYLDSFSKKTMLSNVVICRQQLKLSGCPRRPFETLDRNLVSKLIQIGSPELELGTVLYYVNSVIGTRN